MTSYGSKPFGQEVIGFMRAFLVDNDLVTQRIRETIMTQLRANVLTRFIDSEMSLQDIPILIAVS